MNIIFMGTPEFAVYSLKQLIDAGHNIEAVFTQPDKPQGRKQILTPPPVKSYAVEQGITVYQPKSLRNSDAFETIKKYNPDIIVVVAYGKMLTTEILEFPKYGCVNVHASLLPRHRGASPIQWSIVCGDEKTGVTTMMMAEGMDTGDMLETVETEISEEDNFSSLHDRLAQMGAELICHTLRNLEKGNIIPQKQDDSKATKAPIITREMGQIDFESKTAQEINNLVRGFNPWPSAYIDFDGKRLKIHKTKVVSAESAEPGTVIESDLRLVITCAGNTALELCEVQLEGKNRMTAGQLLNGHPIKKGRKLSD